MPIVERLTTSIVTIGGVDLDTVLSIHANYGWDQSDSSATVELSELPATWSYGGVVDIYIGVIGNVPLRFTGFLREWDFSNFPISVTAICGGPLYKLDVYENITETDDSDIGTPGIDLETITGGRTATLKQITQGVLDIVGVEYDDGNFADPPHVYGLIGPEAFIWPIGETALTYLHRVFEASEGYRLFGSGNGELFLAQVAGQPDGSSDFDFTEGVDILTSTAKHSTIKTKGTILVTGYDEGDGPITATAGSSDPPFRVNSKLIEDETFAGAIAAYWYNELGNTIIDIDITTYRLEVFGPAQTHGINAPNTLGIDANYYVIGNSIEYNSSGTITQTIKYIGHES